MNQEIPTPEQATELTAWWQQAFDALLPTTWPERAQHEEAPSRS